MPCHLCAERSEDYPKPAMFKTPFMATAFPDFKPGSDFLCPKCYSIYFRIIECKYGPKPLRNTPGAHGASTTMATSSTASTSATWRLGSSAAVSPPDKTEAEGSTTPKRKRGAL